MTEDEFNNLSTGDIVINKGDSDRPMPKKWTVKCHYWSPTDATTKIVYVEDEYVNPVLKQSSMFLTKELCKNYLRYTVGTTMPKVVDLI